MGKLRGLSPERAATALLNNAREQAAKREEGALLGALLNVREGEALKERVARLMRPWEGAPGIGGRTLLDVYAMIVAMHAENQLFLSRTVLAYALGADDGEELDRGPLRVLRREAMVDSGTAYVLARHRVIAEVARDWMVENGHGVEQWYAFLARSAYSEYRKRRSGNPDIDRWQFGLARYFVSRGESGWPVARAIAKAIMNADPSDPAPLTFYANTLRRTGQPHEALALMRAHGPRFKGRRPVLSEWSVAAGSAGDHGLDAWLAARSLADDPATPQTATDVKLSLSGLGAAFGHLAAKNEHDPTFVAGQAACGRLGLRLSGIDQKASRIFGEYAAVQALAADNRPSVEGDIAIVAAAALEASWQAEAENSGGLDALIGEPDSYKYRGLTGFVMGDDGVRSAGRR